MLCVAVAEDEEQFRNQLQQYLERYGKEHSIAIKVDYFSNGKEIAEHYRPVYDIVLMDIRMPDMDGMQAAEIIRKQDTHVVLVFITNLTQYAIKGYEVGALDYILKPVDYEMFSLKFARVLNRAESRKGGSITLTFPGGIKRIVTRDIYYVEIQNHMLHYHTGEGEIVFRGTMQEAETLLKPYGFAKCNHWYLVNLQHVWEINQNKVIVTGTELEISRRNRATFLAEVARYLGGNT